MELPRPGKYGPYGKYECDAVFEPFAKDWIDRLRAQFISASPEEQLQLFPDSYKSGPGSSEPSWQYPFLVADKFRYELGSQMPGPEGYVVYPVKPHEPPAFFRCEKGTKNLPSIISLPSQKWAFDENVKTIVEREDQDVHQFFPLEIRMPRDVQYPVRYYLIVFGNWLESFDTELSGKSAYEYAPGRFNALTTKKDMARIAFRKSDFGDAGIWLERGFQGRLLCFSDQVAKELLNAGLLLPKIFKMKEI